MTAKYTLYYIQAVSIALLYNHGQAQSLLVKLTVGMQWVKQHLGKKFLKNFLNSVLKTV